MDHGQRRPGYTVDDPAQFGPNDHGHTRLNIIRACENSLKRLRTDYIDLYQIHRPSPDIPWEEQLSALDSLVQQGKVRYVGCSTHPAWAVMNAIMVSDLKGYARIVCEQPPYNLLDRRIENELIPMCETHGVGIITWSPMAMGVLAGRYSDPDNLPKDSRAVLRGGFYADRNATADVGIEFSRLARGWAKRSPTGCRLVEGTAGDYRTADRSARPAARVILEIMESRLDPGIRAACDELVTRQCGRKLPQYRQFMKARLFKPPQAVAQRFPALVGAP